MNAEAHKRIERLKRKVFWWDGLGALICFMPLVIFNVPFWTGYVEGGILSLFSLIGSIGISFLMMNYRTGHKMISVFFCEKDFLIKATFFVKKQRELARIKSFMKMKALEQEKREKELAIINELERDMRLAGILKDPTKETP